MAQNIAAELETGDYININGTVHEVSNVDGDEITVIGEGTMPVSYLQKGIDNGKVSVC